MRRAISALTIFAMMLPSGCGGSGGLSASPALPSMATGESPFGLILPVKNSQLDTAGMSDIGGKWVRLSGAYGIVWDMVEKTKGTYDWTLPADGYIAEAQENGVKLLVGIITENASYNSQPGYLPTDMAAYKAFLKNTVERYPKVEAWQIGNEADIAMIWKDTPQNYAYLLKESCLTIKGVNPAAKVAIAGMAGNLDFYSQVLQELGKLGGSPDDRFFDIFDFHWHAQSGGNYRIHYSAKGNYELDSVASGIKSALTQSGYGSIPVWITELSAGSELLGQTESLQASNLLKGYVYGSRLGISTMFWPLHENHNFGGIETQDNYFDTHGLINNPLNDGDASKKLAYYTYKKMTEVLEGADWSAIQVVQEAGDVYVYRLTKGGKPVFVAWWDWFNDPSYTQGMTKPIELAGLSGASVIATEAVPKFSSGKEVADYTTAFQKASLAVSNGIVMLSLGMNPVFVDASQ